MKQLLDKNLARVGRKVLLGEAYKHHFILSLSNSVENSL